MNLFWTFHHTRPRAEAIKKFVCTVDSKKVFGIDIHPCTPINLNDIGKLEYDFHPVIFVIGRVK